MQEVARRWGIAYICLTNLERTRETLVGLAVGRSPHQGHITSNERACFASIAPHVRAAVRTQMTLEGQGSTLLAGAMDALSLAAFVCDRRGQVQAMTPLAEKLVSAGVGLQLRFGFLAPDQPGEAKALNEAIHLAAGVLLRPGPPRNSVVVLQGGQPRGPLVLDIIALPRQWHHEFSFTPRALVIARGGDTGKEAAETRRTTLLQVAYRLTASEADVALRLAGGADVQSIAARRGAAVGTVRAQIKTVLAKLGVGRQAELVAKLSQF